MAHKLKVPPFPESVEEGTLTAWHKQEGDNVERDEKVADIETDKIVLEVTAPEAGVLSGVQIKEGEVVKPDQELASIVPGEEKSSDESTDKDESADEDESTDEKEETSQKEKKKSDDKKPSDEDRPRLSPAVRRIVEEEGLDPSDIKGSGRGGVITKADVLAYLESAKDKGSKPESAKSAESSATEKPAPVGDVPERPTPTHDGRTEKRVPMTRIRARIAERLVEAQHTAAILTTFNEVNMKPVMDLRARYKDKFEKHTGVKLGFMSFFVKAATEALKKFPVVNATLDGSDIIYHGYYDVGVAVSTDRGLVVPVLRDADQLSFAEIESKITEFAGRAREGKLSMDDLKGGTFSITNGGIFGSMLSTPILNPPQSAILGMHKIQDRPMAENGEVVIRPIMYLALSYDHRLIDGRDAVQFLVHMKETLEDPARVLLQV